MTHRSVPSAVDLAVDKAAQLPTSRSIPEVDSALTPTVVPLPTAPAETPTCHRCQGIGWIKRIRFDVEHAVPCALCAPPSVLNFYNTVSPTAPEVGTGEPFAELRAEAEEAIARSNPRNHDGLRIAVRPHDVLALLDAATPVSASPELTALLDDYAGKHYLTAYIDGIDSTSQYHELGGPSDEEVVAARTAIEEKFAEQAEKLATITRYGQDAANDLSDAWEEIRTLRRNTQEQIDDKHRILREYEEQATSLRASLARVKGELDAAKADAARFAGEANEYEESEAACCPEDVGFVEYIGALTAKLARIEEVGKFFEERKQFENAGRIFEAMRGENFGALGSSGASPE